MTLNCLKCNRDFAFDDHLKSRPDMQLVAGNKLHVWTAWATFRRNKLPVWATKSRTWRQVAQCWTCSTLSNLLPKQYNSPKQATSCTATSCTSGRGFRSNSSVVQQARTHWNAEHSQRL